VHGETLTAQVRCWGNRDGCGPCPACGFGQSEWDVLNEETIFSCEGWSGALLQGQRVVVPTISTSFLCSVAADLAMVQLFRLVLGLGPSVEDTFLEYCGYTHRTVGVPLQRKPECPCDHVRWEPLTVSRPLAAWGLGDLAVAAGAGGERGLFTVGEYSFAEQAVCGACGHTQRLQRFVPADRVAGSCENCGNSLKAQPFYCHRPVAATRAAPVLDVPLCDLVPGEVPWVLVQGANQARLFRNGSTPEVPS
jgi:hypothetical protein